MITSAPDYLPLSLVTFLLHFFNIFTTKSYDIKIENKYHNTIIGYSCRSLFHTLMSYMNSLNEI